MRGIVLPAILDNIWQNELSEGTEGGRSLGRYFNQGPN
jgi:hypothetical protein